MKKLLTFCSLFLLSIQTLFMYDHFSHHEEHFKRRHHSSEVVFFSLPETLPIDHIHSQEPEKIIPFLKAFPKTTYQLYSVRKQGYFYIDPINDLIKNALKSGFSWERHVRKAINQCARNGSCVLDIGAHIGTHTREMAEAVGPNGRVLAFEPQPKIFRELVYNMTKNNLKNIDFYWAAVGAAKSRIQLPQLNSQNEGGTALLGGNGQHVEMLPIDSLNLSNVSLMKIDVEGMELGVLEGAKQTILANHPTIIIEIFGGRDHGSTTTSSHSRFLKTVKTLQELGYHITQLLHDDWIACPDNEATRREVASLSTRF